MIELKNFIDFTPDERTMVLTWRNDIRVRSFMYTDALISTDDHKNFIDSLNQRKDKLYFVVYKNGAPIGVIDLVDITDTSASLGLYANPFSDRKGIGRIILRALIRYAYENLHLSTLHVECFEENEKAKRLYEKFDFIETKRIFKNNRAIICMELHREYWNT
jgi:UDP-4-amino-4,6-dideoxy-N-acetyl-beta-L-altrosamine N-acetyltransferase